MSAQQDVLDMGELKLQAKENIVNAIKKLTQVTQHPGFDNYKDYYKDQIFDAMKKLTNIKDEL